MEVLTCKSLLKVIKGTVLKLNLTIQTFPGLWAILMPSPILF